MIVNSIASSAAGCLFVLIFACAGLCTSVAGEMVSILSSKDTGIVERYPFANYGGKASCMVGKIDGSFENVNSRCLFYFDVAGSMPEGATVISTNLVLMFTRQDTWSVDEFEDRHTLHFVTKDWEEGKKVGFDYKNADEGATWWWSDSAMVPRKNWTARGGDFEKSPFATFYAPLEEKAVDDRYTGSSEVNVVIAANDIQDLLDNPSRNKGFLLMGNETVDGINYRNFNTREAYEGVASPESHNPVLKIEYSIDSSTTENGQDSDNQSGKDSYNQSGGEEVGGEGPQSAGANLYMSKYTFALATCLLFVYLR